MENGHFYWENSLFLWPFSMVMINYWRVNLMCLHHFPHFHLQFWRSFIHFGNPQQMARIQNVRVGDVNISPSKLSETMGSQRNTNTLLKQASHKENIVYSRILSMFILYIYICIYIYISISPSSKKMVAVQTIVRLLGIYFSIYLGNNYIYIEIIFQFP